MPKIIKLSALRNYTEVLEEVAPGRPVYLTKNGEGKYAIIDLAEYKSLRDGLWQRLFAERDESMKATDRFGWVGEKKADDFIDGLVNDGKA